jgi:sensor domain CHASE-containing protein
LAPEEMTSTPALISSSKLSSFTKREPAHGTKISAFVFQNSFVLAQTELNLDV